MNPQSKDPTQRIYLDNAATSHPKPESVYLASDHALRSCSGNPGRSGHALSLAAGRIVEDTRVQLADLLGAEDAAEICFACNATTALNTAITGVADPGSHIITGSLEHNSVSRPLEYLKSLGCRISVLPASVEHGVDPDDVRREICADTALIVLAHVSNVTGTVNDIAAVGQIAASHNIPFLVDAAQSAGCRSVDVRRDHIDMLAFPGHKGLLGPQGTGGLYIRRDLEVRPLTRGGTGSHSEMAMQPADRPFAYESGTLNVPGIAGLGAGLAFIRETGIGQIQAREHLLRIRLLEGLQEIRGIRLYAPSPESDGGAVVSFTLDGMDPSDIAMMLDSSFGIAVRAGLHCAPSAHAMLGTLESGGTVRVSPGYFNTEQEIDTLIRAVELLAGA